VSYRTIVADPPWPYGKAGGYSWRKGAPSGDTRPMVPYGVMTVDDIRALDVAAMAEDDAHLYLWTTQQYLWPAHEIALAWGFKPAKVLVWCKPPTGFSMGGAFGNACEFVVFARRGNLKPQARVPRDWWEWSRSGGHSAKPEAFLDIVEQMSPGPYLEMFARRARFGWDYWGDQSLGTAEISA
jgi:N6-adenosine-specific RNA methylase IME4